MHKKGTLIFIILLVILLTACAQQSPLPQQLVQPLQNAPEAEANPPDTDQNTAMVNSATSNTSSDSYPYIIVDTGQDDCYSDTVSISCPTEGEVFYGQDAQYQGTQAQYVDNGDGTITDLNTGLMWQQDPGEKVTYQQALAGADNFNLAGYNDWRLPTIKELYSLILFSGTDVSRCSEQSNCTTIPFIDTNYFHFEYGDTTAGERTIDSQWATNTLYVSDVMNGSQAMFGVNFADGRIKGYGIGTIHGREEKTFFVIYVRGNTSYGINAFVDNGDGTITDQATGLTWMQANNGSGLDWENALAYCSNLDYASIDDWRLPNAKELHSIVDYSRSPDTSNSAAIDPIFQISTITNEAGQPDYPAFWSSTTHATSDGRFSNAVYIAFGEALGYMNNTWMDVHGAGAQRADIKSGNPSQLPIGHGPQGDAMRIYNYARCVTGGTSGETFTNDKGLQNVNNQNASQPGNGAGTLHQAAPPQEAIDACAGLATDAACTVNTPDGNLSGRCGSVPSGEFACIPDGGPLRENGESRPADGQRP